MLLLFRKGTCSTRGACKGTRMKYHEVSAQQGSFIWAGICAEQSQADPNQTPTQKAQKAVQSHLLVG